jgi:hypothetical protein
MVYRFLVFTIFIQVLIADFVQFGGELYLDGQNARNAGMGGYSVSFSAGSNPAKLIYSSEPCIHFSHKDKYSGLSNVTTFSFSYPRKINRKELPVFISLVNRSVNNIPDTRYAKNPDGSIDYSRIDYFSQQEIGLAVASNYYINDLIFGFTAKPYHTKLAEYHAWGISGDIGLLVPLLDNKIKTEFWIENIFSFNHWDTGKTENYVPLIMAGGQIQLTSLLLGIEAGCHLKEYSPLTYHAGFEYFQSNQVVIIRGGVSNNNAFSLGMGLAFNMINIDYAYMQMFKTSPFEPSHIFGFEINIDKLSDFKDKISP